MTKYKYNKYETLKDYQKDLLEFLTVNKNADQVLENEINKLRNKDKKFDDKVDYYNFLIERFYPNTSPMQLDDLDPQLNKKIYKAIAELMKHKFK